MGRWRGRGRATVRGQIRLGWATRSEGGGAWVRVGHGGGWRGEGRRRRAELQGGGRQSRSALRLIRRRRGGRQSRSDLRWSRGELQGGGFAGAATAPEDGEAEVVSYAGGGGVVLCICGLCGDDGAGKQIQNVGEGFAADCGPLNAQSLQSSRSILTNLFVTIKTQWNKE
ncbi:hypothetical protein Fmac_000418 [Flemingia macrophylla]|uniref:Uncharacterized protein n=1 Tax=Flemingia macrophylla TaxID=520843 RepID=A0ABD1NEV9_9FABA